MRDGGGGWAGMADDGFRDDLLENHGGRLRTSIEHRIGQVENTCKMAKTGLVRRGVMQPQAIWKVACAIYNRRLRLYGPGHHLL